MTLGSGLIRLGRNELEIGSLVIGQAVVAAIVGMVAIGVGALLLSLRGDDQSPHTEDEIYVCTGGRAILRTPSGDAAVVPGLVVYVPAGEEHRFVDVTADLSLFVLFAPPEGSRADHD